MGKFIDLTGQKFERWTVIERIGVSKDGSATWLCQCECGNKKVISSKNIRSGESRSCGCLRIDVITKHNLTGTRLYNILNCMKSRCYNEKNKKYKYWGGKGIKICDEWLDKENGFANFYEWAISNDYKDYLTIDRIDSDKDYTMDNCRWVGYTTQNNNRSSNVNITANDETHSIAEWSKINNISEGAIRSRIKRGWSSEEAVTIKAGEKRKENQ